MEQDFGSFSQFRNNLKFSCRLLRKFFFVYNNRTQASFNEQKYKPFQSLEASSAHKLVTKLLHLRRS